ncbi:transcriptional repressor [Streptomyces phage Tefunt]|uniref:Immunity repressor n=1 Tax=Streptomyces phage Tefunt TaxID=2041209 RepID=A0A291LHW7_9CAUD|nr:transcriptional repressor [Streptomyces phage Tefunt]ATI18969.1 immunity repressor [Streptomyces phage Tefunt]AXH70233.1 immunity repressor [Streptomyces phage Haizum]
MGARKIVDEAEVIRWFEEGRTYAWMIEKYKEKYNIETVPSMWGNFRRRKGLDRRIVRNDDLIPWFVKDEHRWAYPLRMLRTAARAAEGKKPLTEEDQYRLSNWLKMLKDEKVVVHYDPDTEDGFFYVPRQEGDGDDVLIHQPKKKTTPRPNADNK